MMFAAGKNAQERNIQALATLPSGLAYSVLRCVTRPQLALQPRDRALDLACGNGALTRTIARHVGHVTGVHFSNTLLRHAHCRTAAEYIIRHIPPPFVDRAFKRIKRIHRMHFDEAILWQCSPCAICQTTCTARCGCGPLNMGTALRPESARFWQMRVRLGEALAALGRKTGLTHKDFEIFDRVRDKTPAEPTRFE